jgi:hypothetical protein
LIALFSQLASAQTADEIVEKYLNALGGRAALAKLQSRHMSGTIALSTPAGNIPGSVEIFNEVPNKSRTLMKIDLSVAGMGEATIDQRFNGESGIALDTLQGNRDITGNQLENLKNAAFPTPFFNYKDRGATVELVRKEPVGDRDSYVMLLKPKSGSIMQCFIDAESYLLLKTVIVVNVPQIGGDVQQTTEFSDYRAQDGIKLPFHVKTTSTIQSYTITFTQAEHNGKIDETMFSKPAGNDQQ